MDEIATHENVSVDKKMAVTPQKNKSRLKDNETPIISFVIAALIPLIFIATIYFVITLQKMSVRLTELSDYVGNIDGRTVSLEKKQKEYHGQLSQLDEKLTAFSNSPVLKEVETLSPRVNLLEKQLASIHVRQKVIPARSKPIQAGNRQYYEIKEGDNLFRISKKYGMSVEELARMNDLYEDELIVVGQKLVVSEGQRK